jgi:DNA polymerase-3 subunit beta
MIISCLREDLSNALQGVQRAVSSKSMMPALSGVLMETSQDSLRLHATDLEIYICKEIPVKVEEEGKILASGRLLSDIVRNIESDMVSLQGKEGDLEVSVGKYRSSLRTLPVEDFPVMPDKKEPILEKASMTKILDAVVQVAKAASKDDKRPILQGILMEIQGNSMNLVSTDSYRLAVTTISLDEGSLSEGSFIIPARAMQELTRWGSKEGVIEISRSDGQIRFDAGSSLMLVREIEGKFPNWKQLIPENQKTKIKINRENVLSAIKRASIIGTTVIIEVEEGGLRLSSENREVGRSDEAVEAAVEGDTMRIAFNAEFLTDGISGCSTEEVIITVEDPEKPGVIFGEGDPYKYLIMPIKI